MNFFKLFQEKSKFFFVYLGLLGIINGLWGGALLFLINAKITNTALPFINNKDWLVYILLIVLAFTSAALFQSYMIRLTSNFGNELGLGIFNKLRFTSFEEFEKLGEERVRTALNDVADLQNFPNFFLDLFNAAVMVAIGIGYLFWIDATGAFFVSTTMILLATIYVYRNRQIERDLDKARALRDIYMRNVNDFLRGFKEVKMSIRRSDNIFLKFLTRNRSEFIRLRIKSNIKAHFNELMGNYAWYVLIGIVLFLLPNVLNINPEVRTNFLVTLIFIMGPVSIVIGLMEDLINMKIAMSRLDKFNEIINAKVALDRGHGQALDNASPFKSIRFENVTYDYVDANQLATFSLNPLTIEIKSGEIIFVTGGNGSGKSTFIHLLSGLLTHKAGHIYFNDAEITAENLPQYRDQLSCIFTDNYLFSENYYGLELSRSNPELRQLIQKMKLREALNFDDNNNKLFHALSKGQQKRVALIYAILEEKELLILDEWAAEQDPEFRRYFYERILPDLKRMGKTIVAITHDDNYFSCADRLIKFDYGKISFDEQVVAGPLPFAGNGLK
jgi:putative ATP-binding cassette transporter